MAAEPASKNNKRNGIPAYIGRYQIKDEIARGGMGTVYHGFDPVVERSIAIKVLPGDLQHDPTFLARFEREAKAVAALDHPAVVPIHELGQDGERPYLVMRYMQGGTLTDRLKKGPLSMGKILEILERVGPAIDAAHKMGIYHRDIKPSNILFDQYGLSYLADFGMVRLETSIKTLTKSHAAMGTPGYMSPEQIRGAEIDNRSDIYGLGILIFEMLTGHRAYRSDTPAMTIVKQMTDPVPRVRQVNPKLPREFDVIIRRIMAKQREIRPDSAAEVVRLLRAATEAVTARERETTTAVSPPPPPPPRQRESAPSSPPEQESDPASAAAEIPPPPIREYGTPGMTPPPPLELICPYCGETLEAEGYHEELLCPSCHNQFQVEDHLCPTCFTYHENAVSICHQCDTPLNRVCTECMTSNWAGADSCKSCGKPLDVLASLQIPTQQATADRRRKQRERARAAHAAEQTSANQQRANHRQTPPQDQRRQNLLYFALATAVLFTIAALLYYLLLGAL